MYLIVPCRFCTFPAVEGPRVAGTCITYAAVFGTWAI